MFLNSEKTEVKATLTHTSIGPNCCSALSAAASTWSGSATSVGIGSAVPPRASTSRAAPARPSSPRASRATLAPRAPKASAVARPMPPLAPVTTTTWSVCSLLMVQFLS